MTTVEQILLKLGIDQSQVGPGLNEFKGKVKDACNEGHKSFLHVGSAGRSFHHLINEISAASPGLGLALKFAINPVVGMLAAASAGFLYFEKQIEKANEELDKMAELNAKSLGNMKEAVRDAAMEMAKLCEETEKWLRKQEEGDGKDITKGLAHQLELMESQARVSDKLLERKKALAEADIDQRVGSGRMSVGEGAEQKAKLEIQFAKDKRAADMAAVQEELKAREKAAAELQVQEHQAKVGVSSAFDAASNQSRMNNIQVAEETLKAIPAMLSEKDRQIKDAERKYANLPEDRPVAYQPGAWGYDPGSTAKAEALEDLRAKEKERRSMEADADKIRDAADKQKEAQRAATEKLHEAEQHYERVNGQLKGAAEGLEKLKIKAAEMAATPLGLKGGGTGGGAVTESSRATIEELAQSGHRQWYNNWYSEWKPGPFAEKAREIQKLQGEAHAANIEGDFKTRDADNLRITQLKKELGATGALKAADYMDSIDENIANLWRAADGDGLKVNPANGN